jgi:hypothetical protein
MRPCHGRDRGFESRRLRQVPTPSDADVAELADAHGSGPCRVTTPGGSSTLPICTRLTIHADVAQSVEHVLGKDEVTGSIPVISSRYARVAQLARAPG